MIWNSTLYTVQCTSKYVHLLLQYVLISVRNSDYFLILYSVFCKFLYYTLYNCIHIPEVRQRSIMQALALDTWDTWHDTCWYQYSPAPKINFFATSALSFYTVRKFNWWLLCNGIVGPFPSIWWNFTLQRALL